MLRVDDLHVFFNVRRGPLLRRETLTLKAVDGVSFDVKEGETFSIVGESGCGKTTTSRAILKVETPTSGSVLWQGRNLAGHGRAGDASLSLRGAGRLPGPLQLDEPAPAGRQFHHRAAAPQFEHRPQGAARARQGRALQQVGLRAEDVDNFPHEFSGGQRQRVAIARAIASAPRLIVLDEPVSSLDVSIRAQIMNLLKSLQEEQGFSYLFIAHHLGTVRYMSQMVGVMYLGRLMELSESEELFEQSAASLHAGAVHRRAARSPRYRAQGSHAAERCRGGDRYPERMPAASALSIRQAGVRRNRAGMEAGRAQPLDRLPPLLIVNRAFEPARKERQR